MKNKRTFLNSLIAAHIKVKELEPSAKNLSLIYGISRSTIYRIKNGKRTSKRVFKQIVKIIDSSETRKEQILTGLVAKHVKRYGGIKAKKFRSLKIKTSKQLKKLKRKDRGFLFFRFAYAK